MPVTLSLDFVIIGVVGWLVGCRNEVVVVVVVVVADEVD